MRGRPRHGEMTGCMHGVIGAQERREEGIRAFARRKMGMASHGIETRTDVLKPWRDGAHMLGIGAMHLVRRRHNHITEYAA